MNVETTGQANNAAHEQSQNHDQSAADSTSRAQGKWVKWPDELPSWLSKRIEFALPVWAVAIALMVLALMVLD